MINSKKELKEVLAKEFVLYFGEKDKFRFLKLFLLRDHDYLIWKFVRLLRCTEYHYNVNHKIRYYFYERRKNKVGAFLGLTLFQNTIDSGLKIYHYGSIMINGNARIGKNCQLHGDNCIGNKGIFDQKAPTIGNNVDIGVGAKIIGSVHIADNVKIGANAVVVKSCEHKGAVLVGIPAHEIL